MLIVRGVNVFPSAVREVVSAFVPRVSGNILVRPAKRRGQAGSAAPGGVELARHADVDPSLADGDRRRALRAALVVQARVELVPWGSLQRSEYKSKLVEHDKRQRNRGDGPMRKLQSQGVHHITITGADRQTSIDFWEGVLGMPFVFEQPNLDREAESHLYFDPGDGRLITVFTNEERTPDPTRTLDGARLRAPPRVLALAGDVQAGRRAARRARHQAQRRRRTAASWTRSTSPTRSAS